MIYYTVTEAVREERIEIGDKIVIKRGEVESGKLGLFISESGPIIKRKLNQLDGAPIGTVWENKIVF